MNKPPGTIAAENIVRRYVYQPRAIVCAGFSDIPGAMPVDVQRLLFTGLRIVDRGPCRAVHDNMRLVLLDGGQHGEAIRDVKLGASETGDFLALCAPAQR